MQGRVPGRGVARWSPALSDRVGLQHQPLTGRTTDDRRYDEPAHAGGEDPEADILREMISFAVERPMEVGAAPAPTVGYADTQGKSKKAQILPRNDPSSEGNLRGRRLVGQMHPTTDAPYLAEENETRTRSSLRGSINV